nr:hypothetical protein [Ralstonia pseudosolanacearum]
MPRQKAATSANPADETIGAVDGPNAPRTGVAGGVRAAQRRQPPMTSKSSIP